MSDQNLSTWWRNQMETISALLAISAGNSLVTNEFPTQRPVTRSFDIFFDLGLNNRLSKQWWGWWFETPSCSLWCHCNDSRQPNYYFISYMLFWDHNTEKSMKTPVDQSPHPCYLQWLSLLWYCDVTQTPIVTSFWPIVLRTRTFLKWVTCVFPPLSSWSSLISYQFRFTVLSHAYLILSYLILSYLM